jgi:hypothetical protein
MLAVERCAFKHVVAKVHRTIIVILIIPTATVIKFPAYAMNFCSALSHLETLLGQPFDTIQIICWKIILCSEVGLVLLDKYTTFMFVVAAVWKVAVCMLCCQGQPVGPTLIFLSCWTPIQWPIPFPHGVYGECEVRVAC